LDEELRRLDEQEQRQQRESSPPPPKRARTSSPPAAVVRLSSSPTPPPAVATTADGLIRLVTAVVGRAGRAAIGQALREAEARQGGKEEEEEEGKAPPSPSPSASSSALALLREPSNPADRNAVLVVERPQQGTQEHLGYLPRTVAGYLGPLLDSGLLRAERVATTTTAAATGGGQEGEDRDEAAAATARASAVEVLLRRTTTMRTVCPPAPSGSAAAALESEVEASIAACLEAGRRSLLVRNKAATGGGDKDDGDDNTTTATTFGHAAAFQRILDDVRRYDAHLLSQEELRVLAAVERLALAPRRLLLRLVMRRQAGMRWVPLGSLKYEDIGDVVAAARALAQAAAVDGGGEGVKEEEGVSGNGERPQPRSGGLLRFWSPHDPDPDTWASALASVSCATLQTAGLSIMPRGHPVLRSTKDALVSSLAAVARSAAGGTGVAAAATPTTTKTTPTTKPAPPSSLGAHERLHAAVVQAAGGDLVQVDPGVVAAFRRLQRVYFLDEGLDLGVFLAAERGAVRYPPYAVRRSEGAGGARLAFRSRRALLEYERALADAAALEASLAVDDARGAWRALKPALEAVQARGAHKAVVWAELEGAPVPNPPPPVAGGGGGGGAPSATPPPPPLFLARFSAAWVYASMATVAVSLLEKEKRHREAVDLVQCLLGGNACPARRGEWWSRLCTNLEHHLKQTDSSLEMAEAALADAWVRHGDRLGLQRRVARLCKPPRRWKRPPWAHAVLTDPPERRLAARPVAAVDGGDGGGGGGSNGSSSSLGVKTRYRSLLLPPGGGAFDDDGDDRATAPLVTVEELALQHYSRPEQGSWKGVHAEGGIWRAFFVLFLWEALFCSPEQAGAATADVFRSPFQTAPLDLDTDAFFPARAPLIERRLQELAAGDEDALERTVRMRWAAHAGCACRGMAWGARWDLVRLVEIARCVGPLRLSVVLRLMAEDHAGSSGGMPDLLLWSTAEEGGAGAGAAGAQQGGRAMMVEVKSRNDRLSDQQRMWISALASGGWDVHVLKVTDDG
jgi:hypothetical protein